MSIQSIVNQIIKEAVADGNDKRHDVSKIYEYWIKISIEINKLLKESRKNKRFGD